MSIGKQPGYRGMVRELEHVLGAEDAALAGSLRGALSAAGTPIGPYDVPIAAQTLRRGAPLVTAHPRELARIKGLSVEDWTAG